MVAGEVPPYVRLLALTLLGFKSFPDRTELRFGPGVTAVVGPNGSGKSNIVDAIRWVLGEHNTRALRSPRSADLIFGGTAQRKPLGMGQVTLVIDNSDQSIPLEYSEISIMRRIHRSGESEFFINGTPCRLRDIQELLLGTGLGKSGMAVVGQGEIDAILSADPTQRRLLIEETAGVSRYTAQRRLAEQRLHRAGQDLARVIDLSAELSARAEALKEQAKAAARWRELNEALQAHRAARAARDWLAARARLAETEAQLAEERARLEAAEKEAAAVNLRAKQAADDAARLREQAEQARSALHQAEAQAAAARHRLELADMQRAGLGQRAESLEEELQRVGREQEEAEARLREGEAALARERAETESLKALLAEAEARLQAYDAEHSREAGRLEQSREELFDARQKLAACAAELERLDAAAQQRAAERARWQRSAAELDEQLQAARRRLEEARREADAAAERLRGRQGDAERLALALQAARTELDARRRDEEAARAQLQEVQAHRRALARLEETYAGYHPAVKAVLGAAAELGGVRGTVAQLLDVPARLGAAVQAALGGAAQYIVVDNEGAVLRAIEYLRRRRAGRATFLALDTVRPRRWPSSELAALKAPGAVGVASELVDTDPEVRPVIDYLLGRILVVETLPEAQAIARTLPSGLRLVTLAGDLLVPGGPVTGGSAPSAGGDGLLSRRREQRELAAREERAAAELARRADAVRAALERVKALEQTAASSQDDVRADTLLAAERRQRVVRLEAEVERLQGQRDAAGARLEELERQAETDESRAAALRDELQRLEERRRQLEAAVRRLEEAGRRDEAARRELVEAVAGVRAQLAAKEEAIAAAVRELERWRRAGADAAERRRALADALQRLEAERRELEDQLGRLRAAAPAQEAAAEQAKERLEHLRAALAEAEVRGRQAAAEAAEAARRVDELKERVWAAEAAAARHASALDGAAQRLLELDLRPEQAEDIARQARASMRTIRELEEELAALGAVNLGAEQELAELTERLGFLEEQRQDLERAAEDLEQAIRRLDRVSQQRFDETFARVAQRFDETFRRLFGGGRAELTLLDDGGVDVHVQLPGKRSRHLLALSGGERALTAIALMFALLKVHPSPFYVLDEVDSALDEANLGRFQALLREAAQDSQFIVITHRATTMEVADTLYGVTSAQAGVSTVVSLNLQEAVASIS